MKEQSTTKGFVILSAAGMLVKVLSLLYIPLFRHIIGDEGYGISSVSLQVYTFIFVLTNSGIPVAISKLISELTAVKNYKDAVKGFKIARFILLILGIIMFLALLLFSRPISNIIHYKKAYLSILTLSPAILFTSIASAYRGYFQGRGNMTPTAISQVIEQAVNIVFSIIFAFYLIKFGVEAGVAGGSIGTSLGALASAVFLMFYYQRNRKFHVAKGDLGKNVKRLSTNQLIKRIIRYGIPITMCVGVTNAGNLVDIYNTKVRLMAGGISDTKATILYGFLTKYQQLMNVPITIISSLSMAILPAISAAVAVKDKTTVKQKINYSFRLCFSISVPCAVGLAVLSDPIFKMLKFGGGSYIMAYGSIVLVLMSVMQIQTTILQSIGKLFIATIYSVLGICFKIMANYFLIAIPRINILGAIVGSAIGFMIPILLNHMVIKKSLKIRLDLLSHAIKPALASGVMGVIVFAAHYSLNFIFNIVHRGYFADTFSTVISIGIGAITYSIALILIGGIKKGDLESMPHKITRLIPKFVLNKVV
ncbi:polysaccharide biosynthesis protein [Clostridium sp. JN-1]|uniref:putative polysaccharide biosynthesis protein n=1 Tax=Clostridium sp. JN-1 TaxID=2483110 RepID=UPI000F0AF7F1|nr:polysaccharide biosynthesis protein [Clostridium sp. JN-1]